MTIKCHVDVNEFNLLAELFDGAMGAAHVALTQFNVWILAHWKEKFVGYSCCTIGTVCTAHCHYTSKSLLETRSRPRSS